MVFLELTSVMVDKCGLAGVDSAMVDRCGLAGVD